MVYIPTGNRIPAMVSPLSYPFELFQKKLDYWLIFCIVYRLTKKKECVLSDRN